MPVNEIEPMTIIAILEPMTNTGMAAGSTAIARNVISGVIEGAVDLELISPNPAAGVMREMLTEEKRKALKKDREIREHIIYHSTRRTYLTEYPETNLGRPTEKGRV